jgi:hypothetical protein
MTLARFTPRAALAASFLLAAGMLGHTPQAGAQMDRPAVRLRPAAPLATPVACAPSDFPCGNGVTQVYSETGTETLAAPSAPPNVYNYTETHETLQLCPATFGIYVTLCDSEYTATDLPGESADQFVGYVPAGSTTDLDEFGDIDVSSANGVVSNETDTYSPPQVFDRIPQAKGNRFDTLSSDYRAAAESYGPHGYRTTIDVNSRGNGTYRERYEVVTPAQHTRLNEMWTLAPDGSGSFAQSQTGADPSATTTIFGSPLQSGSSWIIPVTVTSASGTTTVDVPDWLPGGGPPPKRFQSLTYLDLGNVTMPAACGAFSGQPADDLHEQSFYILDPVQGYLQTGTGDAYLVPGSGLVCDVESYTVQYYDNTTSGAVYLTVTNTYVDVLLGQTTGSLRRLVPLQRQAGPTRWKNMSERLAPSRLPALGIAGIKRPGSL